MKRKTTVMIDNHKTPGNGIAKTVHVLEDTTRQFIADLNAQVKAATERAQASLDAALALESRRHHLTGSWKLSEDGTKLIRTDTPAAS